MTKPDLLLLHGALGAADQFAPLRPLLDGRYQLHLLDFEGHGRAPLAPRPFRIEHFVENVVDYLKRHAVEHVDIFGYSLGGYVACSLALAQPPLVRRIVTLGTKFYWDAEVAAREVALLDPQKIAAKVPAFARTLAERHTAGWETVVDRTADLLQSLAQRGGLTAAELARLEQPVRILIGDRDTTVTLSESVERYRALPHAELEVIPGTPHPLEKISPARLAQSLIEFFG